MQKKSIKTLAAVFLLAMAELVGFAAQAGAAPRISSTEAVADDDPVYVVQRSNPIVTDASQFYCNNLSTEGSLSNLLDGDNSTHFITAYNESRITNNPDEYHYLQVYSESGLPSKLVMWWRTRYSTWSNMYRPTHIIVSVSEDGETWTELGEYQNPEANLPVVADVPEYTSPVFTLDRTYYYFRLTVLESNGNGTDKEYSTDGHMFFNFSEFNLYPVVIEGQETLADILNLMEFGPDDYQYGTDPGYIGDQTVWQNFQDVYINALQSVEDKSKTEAELEALKVQFQEAKKAVEAAINPVKDGAYYYISTASTKMADADLATISWYAPSDENNSIGYRAYEESSAFLWKFTKNDDGSYMIQNALTGLYIDSTKINWLGNVPYVDSTGYRHLVKNLTPAGMFSIEWDGAAAVYCTSTPESTSETGNIILWSGQAGSEASWYIHEVSDDVVQRLMGQREVEALRNYLAIHSNIPTNYSVGTKVGQVSDQAAYDKLIETYAIALDEVGKEHTGEEYTAYLNNLRAAVADVDSAIIPVTEGYYRIMVANPYCLSHENENFHTLAWAQHTTNTSVIEWSKADESADFVWKITKAEGKNNWYIQNISTGMYVHCGTAFARAGSIGASATAETKHFFDFVDNTGVVNVYNRSYSDYPYHALNWNLAEYGTLCYAEGDPSKWYLVPVAEDEAEKLISEALVNNRIDSLKTLIDQSTSKINEATITIYDMESPVVTDASNLYSNAEADKTVETTDLANLIDNDVSTIFHSRYNSPEPIDDYHYLRVYAPDGLPEKFGIHWAKRCYNSVEANNEACRPTKIVIGISNDAETWEIIDTLTTADGLPTVTTDTFYTSKKPIESKGYKYFIMKVLEVNNNFGMSDYYGHPFFTMSEYNLYPYAGINPASQINDPEVKAAVEELQKAMETAQAVIDSRNVTDKDIPALQAAYDKLVDAFIDTTIVTDLVEEYTAIAERAEEGEEIGYVDTQDAIDAFLATIDEAKGMIVSSTIPSKAQVSAAETKLKDAFAELTSHVNKIEPYVWYNIKSSSTRDDFAEQPIYLGTTSTGDNLHIGGYPTEGAESDVYAIWRFVPIEGTTDQYAIQNLGTGQYFGAYRGLGGGNSPQMSHEKSAYEMFYYGMGSFKLHQVGNGDDKNCLKTDASTGTVLNWRSGGKKHQQAWHFVRVDEIVEEVNINWFPAQSVSIMTLPWATKGNAAISSQNAEVVTYAINNITSTPSDEGEGETVLTLTQKDEFEAGEPFIIETLATPDENGQQPLTFALPPAEADAVTDTSSIVANGLVGTLQGTTIKGAVNLYFASSVLNICDDSQVTISGRYGYIDATQVTDQQGTIDKTITIGGIVNGVRAVKVVEATSDLVNVYTVDGVLLKQNVKPSEAVKNLGKGIYIVGKKKVLVW